MDKPAPILIGDSFSELLQALLELLESLEPAEWERRTVAGEWTVKDVALHLLGDDVGNLSRRRDGVREQSPSLDTWEELVSWLNNHNETWVQATRLISPRLLCDLLRLVGMQSADYFSSLDPFAMGGAVSWAGPEPAPVWLDLAREFTERWHHQQHIRDAVNKPGLMEPRYLAPVLAAFVHALPPVYRHVSAPEGTSVTLSISGPSGGAWTAVQEAGRWILYQGRQANPEAEIELPEDVAWRLFTKGIPKEAARKKALFRGDEQLCSPILDMVSIIA